MLVWWFTANVDSVLGFWLLVDVGYIAEAVDTEAVYENVLIHYFI